MTTESLTFRSDGAGFGGDVEVLSVPAGAARRPVSVTWITDELVAETRRVWSSQFGRDVSRDEAVEMLVNVRNAAWAILSVTRPEDFTCAS